MQYSFIKSPGKANKQEGLKQEGFKQKGFTIIELLIVIVVIGILAAITVVAYTGIQQRARVAVLQSDLKNASTQLEIDNVNNSTYPATEPAANGGQGLKASPGTTWQYTYNSTWNSYCLTGTNSGASYDISSMNATPIRGVCFGDTNSNGPSTLTCPSGFIVVPGSGTYGTSDFCAMKYEAKQVGATNVPISQAAGTPWVNISQTDAIANSPNVAGCTGCHLITEAEWLTIAQNVVSVASNWSGGTVGSGYTYSGHNDGYPNGALAADTNDANGYSGETNTGGNQRRTLALTNGEVIWDMAGNVWEWTSGQTSGGQPGASGYAWRQWNTIAGTGSLSPNPHPSYGTPAASNWTSGHGIGQIYSSSTDTGLRGFLRGGDWGYVSGAGVLTLNLHISPSTPDSNDGFRVAK